MTFRLPFGTDYCVLAAGGEVVDGADINFLDI
jgi:hypothetical protein